MGAKHSKRRGLSKDDLEYLLENTNYSIETIMAWYRGFKEDCPDGRLTPKAFMHVYGSSFLSANTKEFCDYVFRNFDKDGNGYIDFKEFLLAIHVTSCGSPEDKLGWAFSMYDVDGNGFIELSEMMKLVKSIFQMMNNTNAHRAHLDPVERAKAIFRLMDRDGDGKVSREEFISTCAADPKILNLLTPPGTHCNLQ